MDSLQSYLKNTFPDFFNIDSANNANNDIEKAVEYNIWYKSHENKHPSMKSDDLTEVHLAYWRIKMVDKFRKNSNEDVFAENFRQFLGVYLPK